MHIRKFGLLATLSFFIPLVTFAQVQTPNQTLQSQIQAINAETRTLDLLAVNRPSIQALVQSLNDKLRLLNIALQHSVQPRAQNQQSQIEAANEQASQQQMRQNEESVRICSAANEQRVVVQAEMYQQQMRQNEESVRLISTTIENPGNNSQLDQIQTLINSIQELIQLILNQS